MYDQVSMNAQKMAQAAASTESPTLSRINELNSRVDDISNALDSLEDKLRIGLSHNPGLLGNSGQQGAVLKSAPVVPLHGSLDDLFDRLTTTFHRVNELASRVSL